jgi:16S rRNA (adenine1518-N6/adenine1519-N6)-dimethyltransferase
MLKSKNNMDLSSPKTIKNILSKYEAKPSKGLGQNFLVDKNILNKIIDSSTINSNDVILEVGPGIGTLTVELCKKAKKVIAIEKDAGMVRILKETLKDYKNIEVVLEDVLKYKVENKNYKLIANIPYYLTSPLIRKFLEEKNQPTEIILMIQKEVAKRMCENPPKMNLLAVSVQFYAEPKIISYVSKNSFLPAPKIDSAIIKIIPKKNSEANPELFFKIVKAGFSQPRKQLINNLSTILKISREVVLAWLSKNKILPNQRAETLSIKDWENLSKTYEF